jgi:hypothetical protein
MRAVSIVMTSPAFDEDVGFVQRIEEFPVQHFISQLLHDAQFATGLDDGQPFAHLNLDGPQMPDDLLCCVPFSCHAPSFRRLESSLQIRSGL